MNFYQDLFTLSVTCGVIVFILCDTTAIEVYLKRLLKLFRIKNEAVNPKVNMGLGLNMRLRMAYPDSFLLELWECPVCLAVWVGAILGLIKFNGDLIQSSCVIFFTWVSYFSIRILSNSSNKK